MFTRKEKEKLKEHIDNDRKYNMIPNLTQQFRHCGNAFRIDCYKGCDFSCEYCFANASNILGRKGWQTGDVEKLARFMKKVFEKDENGEYKYPSTNLSVECMRHRVPMHCGGLSDPFQSREWELGVTKRLLELSNEYNYPIMFSTKGIIPEDKKEYWDLLNPKLHAFQLSLISKNEDFIRKYEGNTDRPENRIAFARALHKRGIWTGIRIQPCIDINEALELVEEISGDVNYITVEHLKIDISNRAMQVLFKDQIESGDYSRISTMLLEMNTDKKIEDIKRIKAISKCPIGCGDNDLHRMSDSDCCCGVDTVGPEFNNWIRYNQTYIAKHPGEDYSKLWTPCSSCSTCFFKGSYGKGVTPSQLKEVGYKQYVDDYCRKHPEFMTERKHFEFDLFSEFEEKEDDKE